MKLMIYLSWLYCGIVIKAILSVCMVIGYLLYTLCTPISEVYVKDVRYTVLAEKYRWMNPSLYGLVRKECKKNNLEVEFVVALINAESSGYTRARSVANARGLMQVIGKYHLRGKNPDLLYNPVLNIKIGCRFLKYCKYRAKGNMAVTLKNYNAGCNSNFYNWPYINKIQGHFKATNMILAENRGSDIK